MIKQNKVNKRSKLRCIFLCFLGLAAFTFLTGCAGQKAQKAPCNASGSNCWPRTKINQWYAGDDN